MALIKINAGLPVEVLGEREDFTRFPDVRFAFRDSFLIVN